MSDAAQTPLTDVTVPSAPQESSATPTSEQPVSPAAVQPSPAIAPEAIEMGQILAESGYDKAKLANLLATPDAINSLQYLLRNNPQEFWNTIQRNDPQVFEQHEDYMTKQFVERYGAPEGEPSEKPAGKNFEAEELRSRLDRLEQDRQAELNQRAMSQVESRYDARVGDLLSALPKDVSLTKTQQRAVRSLLKDTIMSDPVARQRTLQGNFVDVPRKFSEIVSSLLADQKEEAEATRQKSEASRRGGFSSFSPGAPELSADEINASLKSDDWSGTEEAFAVALDRMIRK